MKKFEYKGKQWHEECFCCAVCKQPIGNKSFIPRDQEVVCVGCYEENFAQRCMACAGVGKYSTSVCGSRCGVAVRVNMTEYCGCCFII